MKKLLIKFKVLDYYFLQLLLIIKAIIIQFIFILFNIINILEICFAKKNLLKTELHYLQPNYIKLQIILYLKTVK